MMSQTTKKNNFSPRLPGLDGLRAIAVLFVIITHYKSIIFPSNPIANIIFGNAGTLGVDIFFELSGFLITYLILKEEKKAGKFSITNFFVRRFARILPPAYLYIVAIIFAGYIGICPVSLQEILSCMLFVRNYFTGGGSWEMAHFWTLAIEEQFYLIWPIILIFIKKAKIRLYVALFLVSIAPFWRYIFYKQYGLSASTFARTDWRYDALLMGCILAILLNNKRIKSVLTSQKFCKGIYASSAWLIIVLIWFPWVDNLPGLTYSFVNFCLRPIVIHLCILYFINFIVHSPNSLWDLFLESPPFVFVGRLSYSIYLWQQFFCYSPEYGMKLYWFRLLPQSLIFTMIAAMLSFYLVEKPFLQLRDKFRNKLLIKDQP